MPESQRCLYLNSRPMVAGIRSYLSAIGIDVESDVAKGRLVLSSESFGSAGVSFDVDMMLNKLEHALDQALSDGYKGLWATGDMTWEFGSEKNFAQLMDYEYRLEELMNKRPELSGICQYHQATLPHDVTGRALLTHRTIFINETLSHVNPDYSPFGLLKEEPAISPELDDSQYPSELLRKKLVMLVPYFKQGLERNEVCVWLVGDLTVEEATSALTAAVPSLEHYMVKGQMQIRHYTELYTDPDGTVKPADTLRDQFAEMGSNNLIENLSQNGVMIPDLGLEGWTRGRGNRKQEQKTKTAQKPK